MALAAGLKTVGSSTTLARVSPWALIAAALLMGAALLATVWTTHRGVMDASQTLERGQAGVLGEGIRTRLSSLDGVPRQADLEDLLDDLEPEGLTFVALFDRKGTLQAKAGDSLGRPGRAPRAGRSIASRSRSSRSESAGAWSCAARSGARGAAPPTSAQLGGHRPGPMVIEFQPRIAEDLRGAAGQTLLIGAIAAGGLLLAALGLFRWILRREAEGRTLEHERRLASLGEMSAVLAHEIRNPLASLKGNAQLLAAGAARGGEEPHARPTAWSSEAIRLETLTNDLLEFARTGAHPARADRSGRAPARGGGRGGRRPHRGRRRRRAADAGRWTAPRMRQVLTNLLDNAVQSTEAGSGRGPGRPRRQRLVYVVRDRGPGIAEDDLPRMFEPFFTRRTQGTGLGLAVAKRLVELHGGTIAGAQPPAAAPCSRVSLPKA